MNFFNINFLILLGIIIVIYFLYKEINFLHKRLNKIELSVDKCPELNRQSNLEINNKFISDSITDTICSSSSSQHLAIYSNDNDSSFNSTTFNNIELNSSPMPIIEIKPDTIIEINPDFNIELKQSPIIEINPDFNIELKPSPIIEINSDFKIEIKPEPETLLENKKDTLSNLEKMKLPDLRKIAEKNNITLSKKINGNQKQKTKQELIDSIINKV